MFAGAPPPAADIGGYTPPRIDRRVCHPAQLSASDSKMMEARTVAAQAGAASAEQRAQLAERERDVLSEQLAMARQLLNDREAAAAGRGTNDSRYRATRLALRGHLLWTRNVTQKLCKSIRAAAGRRRSVVPGSAGVFCNYKSSLITTPCKYIKIIILNNTSNNTAHSLNCIHRPSTQQI